MGESLQLGGCKNSDSGSLFSIQEGLSHNITIAMQIVIFVAPCDMNHEMPLNTEVMIFYY